MIQDLTHPLPADALTLRPAAQFAPGHLVFLKEHGVMLRFNAVDGKKQRLMLLALQVSEGHSIGSAVDAEKIPGFFFGSVQPVSLSVRMQDDPDDDIGQEAIRGKVAFFEEIGWRIIGVGSALPFRQQYFIDPADWQAKHKPPSTNKLLLDHWRLSLPIGTDSQSVIDI